MPFPLKSNERLNLALGMQNRENITCFQTNWYMFSFGFKNYEQLIFEQKRKHDIFINPFFRYDSVLLERSEMAKTPPTQNLTFVELNIV